MTRTTSPRAVAGVLGATRVIEGAGLVVRRPFPVPALGEVDPFLLLDHFGPVTFAPGQASGVPDHPHAGFEVVSHLLQGSMRHRDSRGNAGRLGPGDVQWMTTGAGIVHSEMPEESFLRTGGTLEGIQLWVNLPAAGKRAAPAYGDVPAATIPERSTADGGARVRLISGTALGAEHRLGMQTRLTYHHWSIRPGGSVEVPVVEGDTVIAYVLQGEGRFGPETVAAGPDQLVLFEGTGESVRIASAPGGQEVDLLLLAAPPLGEPVARWGPFVMNTGEEIEQVMHDFRRGALGRIG